MSKNFNKENLEHWKTAIENCQSRSVGQTIAGWCEQNGISLNQYRYWQKRIRQESILDVSAIQTSGEKDLKPVTFVEIPQPRKEAAATSNVLGDFHPDAVIQIGSLVIGIGNGLSENHLDLILREVANAGRSL